MCEKKPHPSSPEWSGRFSEEQKLALNRNWTSLWWHNSNPCSESNTKLSWLQQTFCDPQWCKWITPWCRSLTRGGNLKLTTKESWMRYRRATLLEPKKCLLIKLRSNYTLSIFRLSSRAYRRNIFKLSSRAYRMNMPLKLYNELGWGDSR